MGNIVHQIQLPALCAKVWVGAKNMTFQFPVRFLAGMTHRLLPVVILALLSLRLSAANVSFVVTNQMTGQPDTNAISVQALNPNANADGSYNSIGLPVWVLPPYVWTNMYQGATRSVVIM